MSYTLHASTYGPRRVYIRTECPRAIALARGLRARPGLDGMLQLAAARCRKFEALYAAQFSYVCDRYHRFKRPTGGAVLLEQAIHFIQMAAWDNAEMRGIWEKFNGGGE